MTCSALDKVAKDFSSVMQGFKMEDRLKGWENVVCRAISSILRSISLYPFPFDKHIFACLMAC